MTRDNFSSTLQDLAVRNTPLPPHDPQVMRA